MNAPLPPVITAGEWPRADIAAARSRTWIWAPPIGDAVVTM